MMKPYRYAMVLKQDHLIRYPRFYTTGSKSFRQYVMNILHFPSPLVACVSQPPI